MQTESFRLRVLRPLKVGEQRLVRGSLFEADAAGAIELLRAGVAVLVDERDLQRLMRVAQPAQAGVPAMLVSRRR